MVLYLLGELIFCTNMHFCFPYLKPMIQSGSKISTLEGHQVEVGVALLLVEAAPYTLSPTRKGEHFPTAMSLKDFYRPLLPVSSHLQLI